MTTPPTHEGGPTLNPPWPIQETDDVLGDELRAMRALADGYSSDFRGTDAGIKFAVLASRLDRLFGMVRSV